MTTMLEKVARAMAERRRVAPYDDTELARAALTAIREPDIETAMLGGTVIPMSGHAATDCAERAFTAMIDAILEEPSNG